MNLEGLTLHLLTQELNTALLGSKIYKVFMPTGHSLLLMLRTAKGTTALLADLNGGSPALYIPEKLPENPEIPPAFCMLLRKHLEEGRITKIAQSGLDRVITLEIDMLGAMSKLITKKLIFELTGKNSNIILVQDDMIIDSLKHVGAAQSSYRSILPGKEYVAPPPQNGNNLLLCPPDEIVAQANAHASTTSKFSKALIATTTGIGKATCDVLLAAADILPNEVRLEPASCSKLAQIIADLQNKINTATALPVHALITRTNQIKTILTLAPLPENLEQGMRVEQFANLNSAIAYAMSLTPIQLPQHEQLQKLVSAEIAKLNKKAQALEEDLAHAENAEQERMLADTLMANLYLLKKGMANAEVVNIYDGAPVQVKLNPGLTPTENAQAYYKRYNKYKRAQKEVRMQIAATEEMLAYLATLDASLLTATTKSEVEEIRQEMIAAGLIKIVGKKNKAALQKSQPLRLKLNADTELYIGKNNKQNDYVTFTVGAPHDLWLHTKDIPGSHVILKTTLAEPRAEDILRAAEIAAFYSKARAGSNVPVDCTQRRFVKKPAGSKPGFVIFTNQKTYYVTPRE